MRLALVAVLSLAALPAVGQTPAPTPPPAPVPELNTVPSDMPATAGWKVKEAKAQLANPDTAASLEHGDPIMKRLVDGKVCQSQGLCRIGLRMQFLDQDPKNPSAGFVVRYAFASPDGPTVEGCGYTANAMAPEHRIWVRAGAGWRELSGAERTDELKFIGIAQGLVEYLHATGKLLP